MAQQARDLLGRMGKGPAGLSTGIRLLIGAGALAYGVKESLYTVQGGQRAIIFSRIGGLQNTIYREGLHFRIPWFQYPIIYDIRAKPRRISSPTGSKGMNKYHTIAILSQDADQLYCVEHQGLDVELFLMSCRLGVYRSFFSCSFQVLKGVVAKFNASQLITQRQQVSVLIRKQLTERANDFGIILDDVSITELSFGKEYTAAVEAKQVAQQEAQRAQFLVEKAVQQRQQKIVQAEGEAEAAYMISFSQPCAVISMYNRQILKSLKQILKWKISHGTN
ncbi:putative prohibitin-2 [Apostichopus japonicus]|uniref:Prohibitin n=1 Tax=Stichopus japonicus TaxID=307972 RepID=A0A2G8K141_STIJA|nr:putative prohibitin-2 [Apostichopus japonicus]